jgi:hypothetical protein
MNGPNHQKTEAPEAQVKRVTPDAASANRHHKGILRLIAEHPLAVLIGIIASVLGVIVSVYFGVWPVFPKRELTYSIQPIRTAIVEVNSQSGIGVTYKGQPVNKDISAAQITVYNAGAEPIRREDIISPIELVVSNGIIVERSFSAPPLPGTEFQLATNLVSGRLALDWKILEKGDKAVIQIVYLGKRDLPIILQGRIVGQVAPKQVILTPVNRKRDAATFILSVASVVIAERVAREVHTRNARKQMSPMKRSLLGFLTELVTFLILTMIVVYVLKGPL